MFKFLHKVSYLLVYVHNIIWFLVKKKDIVNEKLKLFLKCSLLYKIIKKLMDNQFF